MTSQQAGFQHVTAYHPASGLFPMMATRELSELAADIKKNGLREPIVRTEGSILDGRNRLLACAQAGVKPRFEEWSGDGSPTAFVLSKNLHRRHLTPSQQAMIGAESVPLFASEAKQRQLGGLKQGNAPVRIERSSREDSNETNQIATQAKGKAVVAAAQAVGVGATTIQRARTVLCRAPEVAAQVKAGALTVNAAYDQLPKQPQADAVVKERVWPDSRRKVARDKFSALLTGVEAQATVSGTWDLALICAAYPAADLREHILALKEATKTILRFVNSLERKLNESPEAA